MTLLSNFMSMYFKIILLYNNESLSETSIIGHVKFSK